MAFCSASKRNYNTRKLAQRQRPTRLCTSLGQPPSWCSIAVVATSRRSVLTSEVDHEGEQSNTPMLGFRTTGSPSCCMSTAGSCSRRQSEDLHVRAETLLGSTLRNRLSTLLVVFHAYIGLTYRCNELGRSIIQAYSFTKFSSCF